MMGLPLAFTEPLLLIGLVSLPVLWWLLRVMPPRPRRVEFPPTRLLFDIAPKEETPSRTPWWLTALRLFAAALVIFAAAGPVWNPQTGLAGSKAPLMIMFDDGWSAAANWDSRIRTADELIANADKDRRAIALVQLSEPNRDITLMPAGAARVALRQITPKPYSVDRVETLGTVDRFLKSTGDCEIAWLSDGVDTGRGEEFVQALGKTIGDRSLTLFAGGTSSPLALVAAENAAAKMVVKVLRTDNGLAAGTVRALDQKGSPIGEARYTFAPQERETEAAFDLLPGDGRHGHHDGSGVRRTAAAAASAAAATGDPAVLQRFGVRVPRADVLQVARRRMAGAAFGGEIRLAGRGIADDDRGRRKTRRGRHALVANGAEDAVDVLRHRHDVIVGDVDRIHAARLT